MMNSKILAAFSVGCAALACNAFDDDDPRVRGNEPLPFPTTTPSPTSTATAPDPGFIVGPPPQRDDSIPPSPGVVDQRPAVQAEVPPPPISGGTLLATSDDAWAIAAQSDRDEIYVISLVAMPELVKTIALDAGDEPGRMVEGAGGVVHVVLRGSGGVATVDPATGTVVERRQVCDNPRGIAYDSATDEIHVACAEGKLVSLAGTGEETLRTLELEMDLRDVLVRGSELWVTLFKSAALLRIDGDGEILGRTTPKLVNGNLNTRGVPGATEIGVVPAGLLPAVAWRTVATADGGAVIVHQEEASAEIVISEPATNSSAPYGSGFDCESIVRNAMTTVDADGATTSTSVFAGAPLPVDIAVSEDGRFTAIAHAGVFDSGGPQPGNMFLNKVVVPEGPLVRTSGVTLFDSSFISVGSSCNMGIDLGNIVDPTVAVAFTRDNWLLAQTLDPPTLVVTNPDTQQLVASVSLSKERRVDTGHALFHRDSGAGLACASCHPEGAEDGHVWTFSTTGPRRTQALHVGLDGTAPFHWDGDLPDVSALMQEVFVSRMGGADQSPERLLALEHWLFSLEAPAPPRAASDEAAVRGRALFESDEVGCSSCHSGTRFTSNESVAVGTLPNSGQLQVPSLIAIAYRAPFMHNGCAGTLEERFDESCGGDHHGATSQLEKNEIEELIAYLESL